MKITVPFGPLWLRANDLGLTTISFSEIDDTNYNIFTEQAAKQLKEYFQGSRKQFTVPLSITTGTCFQQAVWNDLKKIPFGQTRTYAEIAKNIGSPKAVRAIGQANSKNPLPIIIPCHRVIGKNGSLTGYLGSKLKEGLALKETLLTLEKNSCF